VWLGGVSPVACRWRSNFAVRTLVGFSLVLALESFAHTDATQLPTTTAPTVARSTLEVAEPGWLKLINHYRQLARVAPVTEDPALSRGDRAHAKYLVRNFPQAIRDGTGFGQEAHREDAKRSGATPEGMAAASASDVDEWQQMSSGDASICPSSELLAPEWSINRWISGVFHRPLILNPLLKTVGYGMHCQSGLCAACLDLIHGAEVPVIPSLPFARPIEFPPDGSEINLRAFYLEWPDPRTSCRGYKAPSGLPITLQLGQFVPVKLNAFSIKRLGSKITEVEACGFDDSSYRNPDPAQQALGRKILHGAGMVAIVPRRPFPKGNNYRVNMTVNGNQYDWAFSIR
jgi:hypothetical protein